jgi:hypothetical protein
MTVALDIITDALQRLGVYDANQPLNSEDAQLGLNVLNDLLDSLSTENLVCYANLEQSFSLTVGQAQYQIGGGSGPASGLVRPLDIPPGRGSAYIQDTNLNNFPVDIVNQDQWNMIGLRTITSNIPDTLFYDPQYPVGLINLFPIPNISYTLFFDCRLLLSDLANITAAVTLPPGYNRFLKANLAVELHPYYSDQPLNPLVLAAALESKGNVKRSNLKEVVADYDPEIVSRGTPTYNIYRDRTAGG